MSTFPFIRTLPPITIKHGFAPGSTRASASGRTLAADVFESNSGRLLYVKRKGQLYT